MTEYRSCFNCAHWRAEKPPEWKPAYDGQEFDVWVLRRYLHPAGKRPHLVNGWPGECHCNPAAVVARSVYLCASHEVNPDMMHVLTWDHFDTAGDHYRETQKLQKELKEAKALALRRYHQLQEIRSKPKAKAATNGQHGVSGLSMRGDGECGP